jgi:hypothetical protein
MVKGMLMFRTTMRMILWIGATLMVAVGAIAIGDDGYADDDDAAVKACAGKTSTRQMDNVLFNARALSDSGSDPICAPPQADDDLDGAMLSHSPGSRAGAAQFGFFGEVSRRR